MMTLLLSAIVIITFCITPLVISSPITDFKDKIHLEKLSTVYLPYNYGSDGTPSYGYNKGIAEQIAYDYDNHIVFIVGGNMMHIVDISNVTFPEVLRHLTFGHVDLTDIELCGTHVFVAMDNLLYKENGRVVGFGWNPSDHSLQEKFNQTVGSLPDMIMPTKDCKTIVVAIEAEAYQSGEQIIDPEGGVGIIKINPDFTTSYKKIDFTSYNERWSDMEAAGLRFIHRQNSTFANDVEPEYIALSHDEKTAYVCLQENNGIAIVNLETETIVDIKPLGFKRWSEFSLDTSDKDGEINLVNWPLFGMYQPDTIKVINVGGENYLVTANEGDSKDYSNWGGFNEEMRLKDVLLSDTADVGTEHNVSWAMKNESLLGRLKITTVNGQGTNGKYDALYTFGGRSFSIRRLDTMELVYDSGDEFSRFYKDTFPDLFNNDGGVGRNTISQSKDSRSDDKGVETETLTVAHVGSDVILFVGNERPGSIFIYKISNDVRHPEFQSMYHGITSYEGTWEELYNNRKISEIDPEDLKFIPAAKSPTKAALLLSVGTVSSTLSVFKVNGIGQGDTSNSSIGLHIRNSPGIALCLIFIAIIINKFNR